MSSTTCIECMPLIKLLHSNHIKLFNVRINLLSSYLDLSHYSQFSNLVKLRYSPVKYSCSPQTRQNTFQLENEL